MLSKKMHSIYSEADSNSSGKVQYETFGAHLHSILRTGCRCSGALKLRIIKAYLQVLIQHLMYLHQQYDGFRSFLWQGLKDRPYSKADIGVNRMGDLDYDQILAAAKKKYPAHEAEEKAMEFGARLLDKLKNTGWYPFKILMVGQDLKVSILHLTR